MTELESNITHKDKSRCVGGTGSRTGTIARAEQKRLSCSAETY